MRKNIRHTAVSFNADYINWFDLGERDMTTSIRVKERENDNKGNELATSGPFFESAFIAGSVTDPLAREHGTTVFVFKKAKIDIRDRIKEEIDKVKNRRFDIIKYSRFYRCRIIQIHPNIDERQIKA